MNRLPSFAAWSAAALPLALALSVTSPARATDDDGRFHARLTGYAEVPAVSSPGRGSFAARLDPGAQTLSYELRYDPLSSDAFMAHIHIGQHHTAGGIAIWLCGNPDVATGIPPGTPACPKAGGVVNGVVGAQQVVGPAAQLIAPGAFAEVLAAIRAGAAYVNVHSLNVRSGEIRGQLHGAHREGERGRGEGHAH